MKKGLILFLTAFFLMSSLSFSQAYLEEVRACQYLEKGKIEDALRLLDRKIKRYPRNYDCHLYKGLAYYLQGDFDKAMNILNKTELEIENLEKAPSAMTAGRTYADVDQVAQRGGVVFTKGRKGILKFSLGVLHKGKGDYKNARKRFSDALKYKYPEIEARKQLLVIYCFLKDYKKAQGEFKKLLEAGQESDALSFMEGYLAYHLKDEARAVEQFSLLSESMLVATRNLAAVYYNQGKYQEALDIWQEILEDSPKDADSLRNSGRALFHLGQKEKGQELFDKVGLRMKVEKYSPKKIPLFFEDLFTDVKFDFFCNAKNK